MLDGMITPSRIFNHAQKFLEAYHAVLQPLCRESGLPPMAVDILLFIANNPEQATASGICQLRGLKPGIVSVHVDRLVSEGLLERREVPGDRRKTHLATTPAAAAIIEKGRALQRRFAARLIDGLSEQDLAALHGALTVMDRNLESIRQKGL